MNNKKIKTEFIPQVIPDGDLSNKRIKQLIELGREDDKLDYKEKYDFTGKYAKRSKINLVCDIVSMANSEGGYIIVGVKENEINRKPEIIGVNTKCLKILTQEKIQDRIGNYVDKQVDLVVRSVKLEGKDLVAIFVYNTIIPAPFKKDGQYCDNNDKQVTKFYSGEVYVRHGSKCEKANYEDYLRFVENIREDERQKGFTRVKQHNEILLRLDMIINFLGGNPPVRTTIDLLNNTEENIEDQLLNVLQNPGNKILIKRIISKQFKFIYDFLKEQEANLANRQLEDILEELNRTFVRFLHRLIVVWKVVLEYESTELSKLVVEQLFKLYIKAFKLDFKGYFPVLNQIWFQSRIIYTVYCFGSIGIYLERPEENKLLLNKGNPFMHDSWRDRSWFRYIITMLAREDNLKRESLCFKTFDFFKSNKYVVEYLEGEDEFKNYLCQFDFLQCANAFANQILNKQEMDISECYPSFGNFYKKRTEPIVERIIDTHDKGIWLPKIGKQQIKDIVIKLDKYADEVFSFIGPWDFGGWNSKKVRDFMKNN